MKTSNYIITIPEPCHEDWNKMLPDAKGKFCNSCQKSVYDFTTKTDAEITSILMENEGKDLCGHLFKSQLNRPLKISIPYHLLPKQIPYHKAFAIACFIVFGTMLFSCTNEQNQKIETIEVLDHKELENHDNVLGGMMVPMIDSVPQNLEVMSVISETSVSGSMSVEVPPMIVDSIPEIQVQDEQSAIYDKVTYAGGLSYTRIDNPNTILEIDTAQEKTTSIEETINNKELELTVFPNPNNGVFNIKYELKTKSNVMIEIYDIKGIRVKTLVNQLNQYEGKYTIPSDLSDLTNGTYICRLIKNDKVESTKIILTR